MIEFNEAILLAKGVSEKQVEIIKQILAVKGMFFRSVVCSSPPFTNYKFVPEKPDSKVLIAYQTDSIDCRIPSPKNGTIWTDQEIQPIYMRAEFYTDFRQHPPADLLNETILPTLTQPPFATGILTKGYHEHKNLEDIAKEKGIRVDKIDEPAPYYLPNCETTITLYFSITAIGDTTIEIQHRMKHLIT